MSWYIIFWLPLVTLFGYLAIWSGMVSQIYGGWMFRYDEAPNWGMLCFIFSLIFLSLSFFLYPRKSERTWMAVMVSVCISSCILILPYLVSPATVVARWFPGELPEEALQEVVPLTSKPPADFEAKCGALIIKLSDVCKAQHLHFVGPGYDDLLVHHMGGDYETGGSITGSKERIYTKNFAFEYREDGGLVEYSNYLEKGPDIYDKPYSPKWTAAQAIQIATLFKTVFTEGLQNIRLGEPQARFYRGGISGKKYCAGDWTVSWPRINQEGHFFEYDSLSIQIDEGYGPLSATLNTYTPYITEKGEPMSASDALSRAKNWIFWTDPFEKNYSQGLRFVLPNQGSLRGSGTARLAWMFWFQPVHDKESYTIEGLGIFVDAYTGEIIATDAY